MPARYLFEPLPNIMLISAIAAVLYILPWLLYRKRPDLLLWGLWLPINIFSLAAGRFDAHHTFSLEIDRYTFPASIAIYALIPPYAE